MTKAFTIEDARKARENLGISFAPEVLLVGMNEELEHGSAGDKYGINVTRDDALMSAKIAAAHLYERSDYYERLEQAMSRDNYIISRLVFVMFIVTILILLTYIIVMAAKETKPPH